MLDDDKVKCWGDNNYAVAGLADTYEARRRTREMGDNLLAGTRHGRTAKMISVSSHHTCALLDDYSLKCWGRNTYGQLGYGDTSNRGDGPEMRQPPGRDLGERLICILFRTQ